LPTTKIPTIKGMIARRSSLSKARDDESIPSAISNAGGGGGRHMLLADAQSSCVTSSGSEDDDANNGGSPSKDYSKHGNKKHVHQQRSLLDQLRLWFLTGRLTDVVLRGIVFLVMGVSSWRVVSSSKLKTNPRPYNNSPVGITRHPWSVSQGVVQLASQKPQMVGMYFNGVHSQSFTGIVQGITVPTNRHQWMKLLENRLRHSAYHNQNKRQSGLDERNNGNSHHHLILPVEPLSERIDSIDEDSEDYEEEKPDYTPHPENCKPQYDWQTKNYPTCNSIHEVTMMTDRMFLSTPHNNNDDKKEPIHRYNNHGIRRRLKQVQKSSRLKKVQKKTRVKHVQQQMPERDPTQLLLHYELLNSGYWRDTWMMQTPLLVVEGGGGRHPSHPHPILERVAFKTMQYEHDHTEFLLDKQRRDAVASDRLQFSMHTVKMYSYCGSSALYEWAPGGDLENLVLAFNGSKAFRDFYSLPERYLLAYNASVALTDVHTSEGSNKYPAIVHADFRVDQFVAVEPVDWNSISTTPQQNRQGISHKLPRFKLGDFNLARFPYWNTKLKRPCAVETDGNGGELRAPEEYADEGGLTAKLDVYR
jgi:hypothetical protein